MTRRRLPGRRERGMVLLFALLLMLVAMIAGLAVARTGFASIAGARYERERSLARAAAEAALHDAERDIAGAGSPARAAMFAPGAAPAWPGAGCGQGAADHGLCLETSPPAWQALDLGEAGNPALVSYGETTGASIGVGGLLPAHAPAYLIERLAAGAQPGALYRITAVGFGTRPSTLVVLQALYRTAPVSTDPPAPDTGDPAAGSATEAADAGPEDGNADGSDGASPAAPPQPTVTLPAGRIGAREIVNWRALHAQAEP